MSSMGTDFDLDCQVYSPDGRVFQVEYAQKAVDKSGNTVAICCKDGVVFGVEKLLHSKLLKPRSNHHIWPVDTQAAIAACGGIPDARQIANRAIAECDGYRANFSVPMKGSVLADRLGYFIHMYTLYAFFRPFGATCLLGSYADDGPQLYCISPTGEAVGHWAVACGKARLQAKSHLESVDFRKLTVREGVDLVAKALVAANDPEKDPNWELEIGWISDATGRAFQYVPQDIVDAAKAKAEEALEEEE
eukprot:TRINITY_DN32511_c0_g1_i1.p1 TRINITY_DN32511_c0_g1~~TRINITY_DN32511_c0_g1_i1.p1  ORF type:complete len:248 (+),score=39.05 TRINITY_DN32511_c0_g1_i1:167-910(+)